MLETLPNETLAQVFVLSQTPTLGQCCRRFAAILESPVVRADFIIRDALMYATSYQQSTRGQYNAQCTSHLFDKQVAKHPLLNQATARVIIKRMGTPLFQNLKKCRRRECRCEQQRLECLSNCQCEHHFVGSWYTPWFVQKCINSGWIDEAKELLSLEWFPQYDSYFLFTLAWRLLEEKLQEHSWDVGSLSDEQLKRLEFCVFVHSKLYPTLENKWFHCNYIDWTEERQQLWEFGLDLYR